jgi:site-specific DNA recombinase
MPAITARPCGGRRAALQELLSKLDGIDAVLVYRVDRLSRKQRHVLSLLEESLEPRGVGFKSVTEPFDTTTPMGKAFLGILAVFSQLERDIITARIRDALRHKQTQGQHVGATPFGYARNGHGLQPIPEELVIVGEMRRLRAGGATLREIAAWLVEHRVPTRRGGQWAPENVRYLLSNPRYTPGPAA